MKDEMSQLAEDTAARIRKAVSLERMGRIFGFLQCEKLLMVHGHHEQFS